MSSLDPDSLCLRAAVLRLPVNELARLAGVNKDTMHKAFSRVTSPRLDTLVAARAALEAEERRVLAHLLALYPDAVGAARDSAMRPAGGFAAVNGGAHPAEAAA